MNNLTKREGKIGIEKMELLDLDRALEELAAEDVALAGLIEMRFFGGMTAEESFRDVDV
jgi:hypothetical protein